MHQFTSTFLCLAVLVSLTLATTNQLTMQQKSDNDFCCPVPNPCYPSRCSLPNCFCSGSAIPGNLFASDTPQMIILTFQNAILAQDLALYLKLFEGRVNPNGCPAAGTFFVAHEYTDYFSVQTLASRRHEIGVNSITSGQSVDYWKQASVQVWTDEMKGEIEILQLLANVSASRVRGERAPYLQMGDNNQMQMLQNVKLLYDASRVSVNGSQAPNLLWPYTYDYDSTQDCVIPPCPTESFRGIWQMPLLDLKDIRGNYCATLDGCMVNTASDVMQILQMAFLGRYFSNRAPLVLTMGSAWINTPFKLQGTLRFLDYLRGRTDVYIIPVGSSLDWVRAPTPVKFLRQFKPWQCTSPAPDVCDVKQAKLCLYDNRNRLVNATAPGIIHQTRACVPACPPCYPWINDTAGTKC